METALIILLWIAIIALVYYPTKDLAMKCLAMTRKTNLKKRTLWYGFLVGGLFLILSYPALLPTVFWKILSLSLIGLGFVVYPIAIAVFRWQNRNNPEALKQLDNKIHNSIANAEKYGQY